MDIHVKLEEAKQTGLLHLPQYNLRSVPMDLFRLNFSDLYRLDLGFNHLRTLPDAMGQLTSLEFLWLNDNPLENIPASIYKCKLLQVLDLNRTKITDLPSEMGRMENLRELALEDALLHPKLLASIKLEKSQDVCASIVTFLRRKDVRRQQKQKLYDLLRDGV